MSKPLAPCVPLLLALAAPPEYPERFDAVADDDPDTVVRRLTLDAIALAVQWTALTLREVYHDPDRIFSPTGTIADMLEDMALVYRRHCVVLPQSMPLQRELRWQYTKEFPLIQNVLEMLRDVPLGFTSSLVGEAHVVDGAYCDIDDHRDHPGTMARVARACARLGLDVAVPTREEDLCARRNRDRAPDAPSCGCMGEAR